MVPPPKNNSYPNGETQRTDSSYLVDGEKKGGLSQVIVDAFVEFPAR